MATTWIIAGDLLPASGDLLPMTLALLGGIVVIGIFVTPAWVVRGPDARPDVARRPTLADAVSPPP